MALTDVRPNWPVDQALCVRSQWTTLSQECLPNRQVFGSIDGLLPANADNCSGHVQLVGDRVRLLSYAGRSCKERPIF
jgi:hypothetical protein